MAMKKKEIKETKKEVKKVEPKKTKVKKVKETTLNKKYLSYNMRVFKNILWMLVFFIISLVLLFTSITIKTKHNVVYKQSSDVDYKVYLKPNEYYKQPYLGKNMKYIATLIDNISVDFNYNFSANQEINYKYTYYVNADIAVNGEGEDDVIYSKSERVSEPKTLSGTNSNTFNINENVVIDYNKYNDLVKGFKSSYAVSADSKLILSFIINVTDETGKVIGNLNNKDVMKLTIPLTEQMVNIKLDYKEINNSNTASIYKDFAVSNRITLGLSVLSILISLAFLIKLLIFLRKTSNKKSIYEITLRKLLREYDRVIVNSKNIVDLNDEVIDVNSFSELLDVRDNLEKRIIFSEVHKGQKAVFVVKNETYRYILKAVDIENKK